MNRRLFALLGAQVISSGLFAKIYSYMDIRKSSSIPFRWTFGLSGAATRPPVGSVLRLAHLPRITFHPAPSYRPGRPLAASRPRWRPCPDPPRARPCAPSGCGPSFIFAIRASSSVPDSSTLCSTCASCASDRAVPRSSRVGVSIPDALANPRKPPSSRRYPVGRSATSPHSISTRAFTQLRPGWLRSPW